MANNNRCGCSDRRNGNNGFGCLGCLNRRCRWEGFPYYMGPCPDANGGYECDCEDSFRPRRCGRCDFGIFTAMLPMAVAANGTIPLVKGNCGVGDGFAVNSGLVTVEEAGTYLATYTVRLPEGADVNSTMTLNVNDASQSPAIMQVGGTGPVGFTAQAMIDVPERSAIALRTSEAINVTESSQQPLVTLTLVKV